VQRLLPASCNPKRRTTQAPPARSPHLYIHIIYIYCVCKNDSGGDDNTIRTTLYVNVTGGAVSDGRYERKLGAP
jgi:hypothetical protein